MPSLIADDKYKYYLQALVAVIGFCALLYGFGYKHINPEFFLNRDDALICYSHAVNLVDYGFSGVNPSGERVEAYSTPLLFITFWIYYALTHGSFEMYVLLQTVVCTVLMAWLIFRASPFDGWRAVGLTLGIGLLLSQHTRWMQWHASGMENALTEVAMLGTVAAIMRGLQGKPSLWHAIPIGLLGIARVEFVFFSVPLAGLYLLIQNREKGWQTAWASVGAGMAFTATIHIIRIAYYGTFQPNTSWAQGLSLTRQLGMIAGHDTWYVGKSNWVVSDLLMYNGAYLALFGLGLVAFLGNSRLRPLAALAAVIIALTLTHGLLFCATRLDPMRYGTHMAPICLLLFGAGVFSLEKNSTWAVRALILAAMPVAWFFTRNQASAAGEICCNYKTFVPISDSATAIAKQNQITRLALANPDLGITSYRKNFNIVDMANIGTSAMARLSFAEPFKKHYLFNYAAPDLVELHLAWSDYQKEFLGDYRFKQMYTPRWTTPNQSYPKTPNGLWMRNDVVAGSNSRERVWMEVFAGAVARIATHADLSAMVRAEVARPAVGAYLTGKTYIARTIYRHLPEIRQREGLLPVLVLALKGSPTFAYDSLTLYSSEVRDYGGKVSALLVQSLMREIFHTSMPLQPEASLENYVPASAILGENAGWRVYYNTGVVIFYAPSTRKAEKPGWVRVRVWMNHDPTPHDVPFEPNISGVPYNGGLVAVTEAPYGQADSVEISSGSLPELLILKRF